MGWLYLSKTPVYKAFLQWSVKHSIRPAHPSSLSYYPQNTTYNSEYYLIKSSACQGIFFGGKGAVNKPTVKKYLTFNVDCEIIL